MVEIGQKIAYISRRYDSETNEYYDFKLLESKVNRINIGKNKITVYENPKLFRQRFELDDYMKLSKLPKGVVLVEEPLFVTDDEIEYLKLVVDDWNKNGTKSILE